MKLTKDNIVLVDNEIIVINRNSPMQYRGGDSETKIFHNKHFGWQIKIEYTAYPITHATNHSLEGVKHLDRNLFVKKVDVEELAETACAESDIFTRNGAVGYIKGFVECYSAKEGEFTEKQLSDAMEAAFSYYAESIEFQKTPKIREFIYNFIYELRPLSIPESIELDDELNVVNVKW